MRLYGRIPLRHWAQRVPEAVKIYALFGLLDFGFSLTAFKWGFGEANPVLAWYKQHGLFEIAKVGSTLAVILLGFFLWELKPVRWVIYLANVAMVGVVVFHIYWLASAAPDNIKRTPPKSTEGVNVSWLGRHSQ